MSPQPETCPGCGADVHTDHLHCHACGRALKPRSRLLPVLVGLFGVLVALAAGVGVWVLLAPKPGPTLTAQTEAPPPAPAPVPPVPTAPSSPEPPPAAALVPPAASQLPTVPPPASFTPVPGADLGETLPLPTVRAGTPPTPSDPGARREFAKTTQDNFVQNGLDMVVTASGADATILTMKFNFPAKTAVELIVSGPFPRQCKTRGFQKVIFTDPTGANWTYDVTTEKLSQK